MLLPILTAGLLSGVSAAVQDVPDARALGVPLTGAPAAHNAITDVAGVEVGQATISQVVPVEMLPNDLINPLFRTSVHATEEAIRNAMFAAETMTGVNGYTVPALPRTRLAEIMESARP